MNVAFHRENRALTVDLDHNIVNTLGSIFVNDPIVVDGIGEKIVIDSAGRFVKRAEIVEIKWKTFEGRTQSTSFSGTESYIIQDIIEELESLT